MLIDFVCERPHFFFCCSKTLSPEDGFLVIFEQLKTFLNYQLTRSRYTTTDWEDDEVSEQRGRRSETSFWSEQEEGRTSGRAEAERDNTVELFYALSIMSRVKTVLSQVISCYIPSQCVCLCEWLYLLTILILCTLSELLYITWYMLPVYLCDYSLWPVGPLYCALYHDEDSNNKSFWTWFLMNWRSETFPWNSPESEYLMRDDTDASFQNWTQIMLFSLL